MRVFVWSSYGNSSVYAADNPEDLGKIYRVIRNTMSEFYSKEDLVDALGPDPDLLKVITERNVNEMLDWFVLGEHESFEFGSEFTTMIGR